MNLKLQNSVSSRQDLRDIILQVRSYSQWLAQANIKKRYVASQAAPEPAISSAAADLISQWSGDSSTSQKSLDELITTLEDFEGSAPNITITLAGPPPGNLKTTLISWCRQNINPNILVDFKFDSTILGGMVIRYGSHIHDWSFKRQILASRDKFPEVLRRV